MGTVAERVGRGPCPHCNEMVTFKRSSGKLLNFKCDACLSSSYAEPSGSEHAKWMASIKPTSDPVPKPVPKPAPDLTPEPAAPKAKRAPAAAFSLGQL